MPHFGRSELFDKKDFGLVPVAIDVLEGFVFVWPEPHNAPPLAQVFAGIAERILSNTLTTKLLVRRVDYDVPSHWKVCVDNFLEGNHIPHVHPELNNALDYSAYATVLGPWHSLQYSALKDDTVYTGNDGGEAFHYWVYPNFMLSILPDRAQVNLVLPSGHNRCSASFWAYYDTPETEGRAQHIQADIEYSDMVQEVDREICQKVHAGLESRGYTTGRFSPEREASV